MIQLAHEGLGHNGSPRTYALIKRHYYWKGLKPTVKKHVQTCRLCQEHNKQVVKYSKMNFEAEPAPMKFISMDLIGEFHPPSSKGNRYALTVICMFTGYTFCIPIPNKMAKIVLKAYMHNVYCQFGGSLKIIFLKNLRKMSLEAGKFPLNTKTELVNRTRGSTAKVKKVIVFLLKLPEYPKRK